MNQVGQKTVDFINLGIRTLFQIPIVKFVDNPNSHPLVIAIITNDTKGSGGSGEGVEEVARAGDAVPGAQPGAAADHEAEQEGRREEEGGSGGEGLFVQGRSDYRLLQVSRIQTPKLRIVYTLKGGRGRSPRRPRSHLFLTAIL